MDTDETYTTSQGDTWDNIALEVYGDESYAGYLMANNYWCLDTFVFSDGIVINAPPLLEDDGYEDEGDYEEEFWEDDIDPYDEYEDGEYGEEEE